MHSDKATSEEFGSLILIRLAFCNPGNPSPQGTRDCAKAFFDNKARLTLLFTNMKDDFLISERPFARCCTGLVIAYALRPKIVDIAKVSSRVAHTNTPAQTGNPPGGDPSQEAFS